MFDVLSVSPMNDTVPYVVLVAVVCASQSSRVHA